MKPFALSKLIFDIDMKRHNITPENVVQTRKNACFISINETTNEGDKYPELKPYFPESKENVLVLYFDDVTEDTPCHIFNTGETIMTKAFTEEQGKTLLNFIEVNKDKAYCFVHCAAGISRSGAVATFINDYFEGDYQEFKSMNPHILPNVTVLAVMNKLLREKN
jgi:predicted protein tyrosine phosphatase